MHSSHVENNCDSTKRRPNTRKSNRKRFCLCTSIYAKFKKFNFMHTVHKLSNDLFIESQFLLPLKCSE